MSDFQPKDFISLEGAIDIHMHPHPCLFDRLTDDWGVAEGAKSESMRGIVIKCHHESTVSRAQTVTRTLGGIEVYGGIVLNFYVGGLNAGAAEAACKTGGKIVWMPTIDAENHAVAHGSRSVIEEQVTNGVAVRMACLDVLTRRARGVPGWERPLGQGQWK